MGSLTDECAKPASTRDKPPMNWINTAGRKNLIKTPYSTVKYNLKISSIKNNKNPNLSLPQYS